MLVVIVEKNGAGTNLTLVWMTRRARNIQQFTSRAFFLSLSDYLEKRDREKKRTETEEKRNVLQQCSEFDLCQSKQSITEQGEMNRALRSEGMHFFIFILKSEWQVNCVLDDGGERLKMTGSLCVSPPGKFSSRESSARSIRSIIALGSERRYSSNYEIHARPDVIILVWL